MKLPRWPWSRLDEGGSAVSQVPQTYRPVLESQEVIDLFGRMTLHQQAALMRLMSRNLCIQFDAGELMGYELEFSVEHAMVVARIAEAEPVKLDPPPPIDA